MINNIGFMQGRLCDQVDGMIQAFPWKDWEKEFKTASEIGINLMEWTIDFNNLNENPLMQKEGRIEISNLSKKYTVKINSLTGDCFMQKPFWKSSGSEKENLRKDFLSICKACSALGIRIIVIPLVDNGSLENIFQENELVHYLNGLIQYFEELNLQIIFESDYKPKNLKNLIDRLGSNIFGINFDTGNSSSMGFDPSEEITLYGERIKNVHIKDRKLNGSTVPLGEGNADFESIFFNLKKIKYSGNFILQTARDKEGKHAKSIKNYYEYIFSLVEKYLK